MTAAPGIPVGVVRPRALAPADALPAFEQGWAPADCMRPDFVAGVEVTHTVPGVRGDAFSGARTARATAGRCRREFEVVLGAQSPGDCAALSSALRRLTQAPCTVPLWSEMAELTADVFGGFQDYVECDPSWRLFAEGQRVMVVDAEAASGPFGASSFPDPSATRRRGMAWPFFELHTIRVAAPGGSIRTDRVVIDTGGGVNPIVRSFRAGARLVPLLDVERLDLIEWDQITSRHMRARVALRERGPSANTAAVALGLDTLEAGPLIPGLVAFGAAPEGAPVVDGLPLLDLRFEAGAGGATRGGFVRTARDGVASGPRGFERLRVEVVGMSRARARRLLQFFEGRGGATLPFYAALPGDRLRPAPSNSSTISGTTINIERTGWATREAPAVFDALPEWIVVEVRAADGSIERHARRVTARANITQSGSPGPSGPVERLTLDSALPAIARSAVRGVYWIAKVRFGSDSLTERWMGGAHARSSFTLEEQIDERSVQVGAVREAGVPCAECLVDLGESCPGSPSWPSGVAIPTAPIGSDEETACALDEDNDLILAAGAAVRVAGSLRVRSFEPCGFPVTVDRLSVLAEAAWDADLPRDASIWPATERWRIDTGPRELAVTVRNHYRWLGPLPACTGPTFVIPGSGAQGVVAAQAMWRNARSPDTRLYVRVAGLKNPGDHFIDDAEWYVQAEALASGGFNVGGGLGAISFSPLFVPWSAAVTSREGITSLAASFAVNTGQLVAELTLTAHVCPVYACAGGS